MLRFSSESLALAERMAGELVLSDQVPPRRHRRHEVPGIEVTEILMPQQHCPCCDNVSVVNGVCEVCSYGEM